MHENLDTKRTRQGEKIARQKTWFYQVRYHKNIRQTQKHKANTKISATKPSIYGQAIQKKRMFNLDYSVQPRHLKIVKLNAKTNLESNPNPKIGQY